MHSRPLLISLFEGVVKRFMKSDEALRMTVEDDGRIFGLSRTRAHRPTRLHCRQGPRGENVNKPRTSKIQPLPVRCHRSPFFITPRPL